MRITFTGTDSYYLNNAFFDNDGTTDSLNVTSHTSTQLTTFNSATGYTTTFTGSGITVANGSPTGGTITSITYVQGGITQATITDISWGLVAIDDSLNAIADDDNHGPLADLINSSGPITVDATGAQVKFDMEDDWQEFGHLLNQPVTVLATGVPGWFMGGSGNDRFEIAFDPSNYDYSFVEGTTGNDVYDFQNTGDRAYYDLWFDDLRTALTVTVDGVANTGGVTATSASHTFLGIAEAMSADGIGLGGGRENDIFNVTTASDQYVAILGLEGNDTYNLTNAGFIRLDFRNGDDGPATTGVVIDLGTGVVSNDGLGFQDQINLTAAPGSTVEVRGTDNADSIMGSARNDSFITEQGNDTVDGGDGFDRLRYNRDGAGPVNVDLEAGIAQVTWDGFQFTQTISNIEWVRGSNSDVGDTLSGSAANELLDGYDGDDSIDGRGGNDELYGGYGNDTINGGAGQDTLFGWVGDDLLLPGDSMSFDRIDPHSGNDTVDARGMATGHLSVGHYDLVSAGPMTFTVNGVLNTASIDKGVNGTTTILGVADAMDADGVSLDGSAANDSFDVTVSDNGFISLRGGQGTDSYTLGASDGHVRIDLLGDNYYNATSQGVSVDLASGTIVDDGFGNSETITGVGNVYLSIESTQAFADTLLGSSHDENFLLRGGDDSVDGRGGIDRIEYRDMQAGVIVNLAAGTATGTRDGNGSGFSQSILGIESVKGTAFGDSLTGSTADETLMGADGNDLLAGARGSDLLQGEGGFDVLMGDQNGLYHIDESAQIFRLYAAVFGREPDVNGHQGWVQNLVLGNATLNQVAAAFVASPEFQATYGDATNAEFVTLLYDNVLGRTPSTVDRDYWVGRLDGGETRERVVLLFSETPEHQNRTAADQEAYDMGHDITTWTDDVYRVYRAIFDRDPDIGGFLTWTDTLAAGRMSFPEVIESFMASPEFQDTYGAASSNTEFVTLLYENVLKRAPDANGLSGWVASLDGGMDRAKVVGFFMASPEFVDDTAADLVTYVQGFGPDDVLDAGGTGGLVSGGLFADTFVFSNDDSPSTITVTDVESWDTLAFNGFDMTEQELLDAMTQVGDDVTFAVDGESIVFANTDLSLLSIEMIDIA